MPASSTPTRTRLSLIPRLGRVLRLARPRRVVRSQRPGGVLRLANGALCLLVSLLACLLAPASASAQRQLFHQYGSSDGLSNLNVKCILEDHTGYVWVGTDNGLFRYDGTSFLGFGHAEGLANTEVLNLAESPDGQVWAVTQGGVEHLAGNRFVSVQTGQPGGFTNIAFDPQGRVYITSTGNLLRGTPDVSEAGTSYHFQTLATGPIRDLSIIGKQVYFAMNDRLWQLNGGHPQLLAAALDLPLDRWGALVQDSQQNLWVRSPTRLFELPHDHKIAIDRSAGVPHAPDPHLFADTRGHVFVSSIAGLVTLELPRSPADPAKQKADPAKQKIDQAKQASDPAKPDPLDLSLLDRKHGLPADSVGPIFVDRDNSLWMGIDGAALVRRLGQGQWLSWNKDDGLLNNSVWAIHTDPAGKVWVGTSAGLTLFDPKGKLIRSWSSRNGLAGDRVYSIAQSPSGDLYVGTDPASITRFDPSGRLLETYGAAQGLVTDQVNVLLFDHEGFLWAAGIGGCFRSHTTVAGAQPGAGTQTGAGTQIGASAQSGSTTETRSPGHLPITFDRISIPTLPADTIVRSLVTDAPGSIWFATSSGLVHLDHGRWTVFTERQGLRSSDLAVLGLVHNVLWFAYRDALGIAALPLPAPAAASSSLNLRPFTREDGLGSDQVYGFAVDHQGSLWASTDKGISLFKDGHWGSQLGSEDGLIWDDTDSLALDVDPMGNVWIGTSGGLSRFSPSAFTTAPTPPGILITAVEGIQIPWQPGAEPDLPYSQRSLTVRYASLRPASQSGLRFRYRLLGSEVHGYQNRPNEAPDVAGEALNDEPESWSETQERSVHFAALPKGHYLFEVIAVNADGLESAAPARLVFSIEAPWWQSSWFILLAICVAAWAAFGLWHLRVRVLMGQKAMLERQVADRTAELVESHRKLEEIAYFDLLTALPNRRKFAEEFRKRLINGDHRNGDRRRNDNFALLLIDLDFFKAINDEFGHDAGDAVLVETAFRLRAATRDSDCVARIGGDEFAILLSSPEDVVNADQICRRLLDSFTLGIPFRETELLVGCSIGIAVFPEHGETQEKLYKTADLALYQAKRNNRNTFSWYNGEPVSQGLTTTTTTRTKP